MLVKIRHRRVSSLFYYPGIEHTRVFEPNNRSSSSSLINRACQIFQGFALPSLLDQHTPFIKFEQLECSTVLIPGFEHQLRLELVEQLEFELPCLVSICGSHGFFRVFPLVASTFSTAFFTRIWQEENCD